MGIEAQYGFSGYNYQTNGCLDTYTTCFRKLVIFSDFGKKLVSWVQIAKQLHRFWSHFEEVGDGLDGKIKLGNTNPKYTY